MTNVPTTMNALVLDSFGPPEKAFKYSTVPVPRLVKPTDVLIRVVAASINPIEAKMRSGNIPSFFVKKKAILGADYSGVVVEAGAKVVDFKVNDAVFGTFRHPFGPQGTYAEYVVVDTAKDEGLIAKKPDTTSFVDAAALGIAALTSMVAIVDSHPDPIKKVLVIGASGGVGMFGIQMAKERGAYTVGICSGRNKDLVLNTFGADRVVDYTQPNALAQEEPNSYDIVFDLIGGDDYYNSCMPLVKEKTGIFISAVGPAEHFGSKNVGVLDVVSVGATYVYRKLFASRRYAIVGALPHNKIKKGITPWLEPGKKFKSYVPDENIFDLKDGAKAHAKIDSHRAVGKIVLRVSPDPL